MPTQYLADVCPPWRRNHTRVLSAQAARPQPRVPTQYLRRLACVRTHRTGPREVPEFHGTFFVILPVQRLRYLCSPVVPLGGSVVSGTGSVPRKSWGGLGEGGLDREAGELDFRISQTVVLRGYEIQCCPTYHPPPTRLSPIPVPCRVFRISAASLLRGEPGEPIPVRSPRVF